MPALDDSLLGTMLDEYRVESALGKGGMARVYLALDTRLQRYVALKVIAPDLRADQEHTLRFEREAQSIARLDHPNIVHIFRFGTVGDLYYMAMQYIDGADLQRIVTGYRHDGELMALTDVARVVQDIGAALDYAHGRGVIHRDVKPGNIMLDQNGKAVLTDFGLALLGDVGTRGEVFGSPHYIAPEQAISSGNVVPQSDLYALGVVLYYMLTGEVPFVGSDAMEVALRHVSEAPRPPSALNPALSPDIDAVVLHCLEKEPQNRYRTGAEFSAALNAAISAASGAPTPEQPALSHSQLHVSQRIHEIERVLPPLPEVETLPPLPPDHQQETQPVSSGPTFPSWAKNPAPPQEAAAPRPNTTLGGALRRVSPRLWIAVGLAFGALLIVILCGLLLLSLVSRNGNPRVAAAPDTATPTPTMTSSSTPTLAPSPTRTIAPTPTALVLFGAPPPQAAFPTMFPATFQAIPPTAVLPGVLPPDRSAAPPGSRRLGEFAVEWYCNERGLGVRLVNGDVDWACTNPDNSISFILQPTDFDQMCRTWYTNPNAFAVRDQQNQTQAYSWSCYEYTVPNVMPNQPSLATPSIMSLHVQATRDWVAFSNDSTLPLDLAGFYLEREGRRIDASAWGRSVLNPGECLVIHKRDELPEEIFTECALPLSLTADRRDREYWLKGEVLVHVNPDAQYSYSAR